ncbi:MAG: hypothetical protein LOX97_04050 [Sphingomonas sp.]|nr:hypothetical protein [Sphingomonas sp.]
MTTTGRDVAAPRSNPSIPGEVQQALNLMEGALRILDDHGGPHDAGAHLDLAVHRLREWLQAREG